MSATSFPFWRVVPAQSGREGAYTLPVMLPATVGPEGAPHIMGGVALAAVIDAMELASSQPILWANAQFLSPTQHAEELDITCEQCGGGQSVGQWMANAYVNGRPTHRVSAALGAREPSETEIFITAPGLPSPDECEALDKWWSAPGSLQDQVEMRLAHQDPDKGYNAVWVRNVSGFDNDSGWLAVISDFFLGSHPKSAGGGSSLDATFRFIQSAPPGWVLSVTQMGAIDRGVIHGQAQHFSEDGKLLALSSQTGVLPRIPRH